MPTDPTTPAIDLTDAQRRTLEWLSPEEYKFPTSAAQSRTCGRLEDMGLADGRLEPAVWDSRRGLTQYKRAYRRTVKGRKRYVGQ